MNSGLTMLICYLVNGDMRYVDDDIDDDND